MLAVVGEHIRSSRFICSSLKVTLLEAKLITHILSAKTSIE
jgi:hypothetical protein